MSALMDNGRNVIESTVAVHEDKRNAVILKIHAVTARGLDGTGQKIRITVAGENIEEARVSAEHLSEELSCCFLISILAYNRCRIAILEKARKIVEHKLVNA